MNGSVGGKKKHLQPRIELRLKKINDDPEGQICNLRAVVWNNLPLTDTGVIWEHQQTRTGEH